MYYTGNSTWSSNYTINYTGTNNHRTPNIAILPNDRLISFYGAWGDNLKWRISTNTTSEIEEDYARLGNWDSENIRVGSYSYPQAITLDTKMFLFFILPIQIPMYKWR